MFCGDVCDAGGRGGSHCRTYVLLRQLCPEGVQGEYYSDGYVSGGFNGECDSGGYISEAVS